MRNVGGFSGHNWGTNLCVESPLTRHVIEQALNELSIMTYPEDLSFLYVLLSAEDQYMCFCDRSMAMFEAWLNRKYVTIEALNRVWGTHYKKFRQAKPPRYQASGCPVQGNRAAWYDWQLFNRDRVSDFYVWLKLKVRQKWPHVPVTAGTEIRLSSSRLGSSGIDAERLNESVNDVLECETLYQLPTKKPSRETSDYGMDIFGEAGLDFQRSLSRKPAVDLEFHAWTRYLKSLYNRQEMLPHNYTSSVILRHYLHGIRSANFWVWQSRDQFAAFKTSPAVSLESVEECFKTALDVRRLSREITELSEVTSPVAILMSDSTFMQIHPSFVKNWNCPTPCTVALDNAYHACLFQGLPIKYVTERSIATGDLSNYKIVLLPAVSHLPHQTCNRLVDFVKSGGVVIMTPNSLLFDEYNHPADYLSPFVEITKTEVTGLPVQHTPSEMKSSDFIERQVVDPADARIPAIEIIPTASGPLSGGGELRGVGVRQWIRVKAEHEIIARFADQNPAIAAISYGKGKIYYCAMPLKPSSYAALLESVYDSLNIKPLVYAKNPQGQNAWGIESRSCEYSGDYLISVINTLAVSKAIELDSGKQILGVHDLVSNKTMDRKIILEPLQTVILRLKVE